MDFRAGRGRARHERRLRDHGAPPPGQPNRRAAGLAVIRWVNPDGTDAIGHPLPRPHAEALLQAYEAHFPALRFWLEVPAALDRSRRTA